MNLAAHCNFFENTKKLHTKISQELTRFFNRLTKIDKKFIKNFFTKEKSIMKMLINGIWRDAVLGKCIEVYNPATNMIIDTVPRATKEDVEKAV